MLLSELSFFRIASAEQILEEFLDLAPESAVIAVVIRTAVGRIICAVGIVLVRVVGRIQCAVTYDIIAECTVIRIVDDSAIRAVTAAEDSFDGIPEVGEESLALSVDVVPVYSSVL